MIHCRGEDIAGVAEEVDQLAAEVELRAVTVPEHLKEIVGLQEEVWGPEGIISLPQIVAASHNGGVVIGAFLEGKVVGFCYGFAGFDGAEVYLCSHQLAVLPDRRNLGLGRRLKLEQRAWALAHGYRKIEWTFDPLEARNGFLNLCKLGGYVRTYIRSYYGEMDDELNRDLPSDRFLLEWDLESSRVERTLSGTAPDAERWRDLPALFGWEMRGSHPKPGAAGVEGDACLVPIPRAIQDIKRADIGLAREWRFRIADEMERAFSAGYKVVGILRSEAPVYHYVLDKGPLE